MKSTSVALAFATAIAAPQLAHAINGPSPGAASAQTVKVPDGPGSVRGLAEDGTINGFDGQVEYAIPIDLPSAPGGLSPTLQLSYSGSLGNGPLGIGWTLGQAEVRRSLRLGVPAYDASDELEVSGLAAGRLVPIGGGAYRVEGLGNAIAGEQLGAGFVLVDSDGLRYELGVAQGARHQRGGRIASWKLERVTDLVGQSIEYTYESHRGQVYLEEINWGPGGAYRADLVYEDRDDVVTSWRSGFEVVTAQRLAAIELHAFGTHVRTVELRYDDSFALTRLSGVRVVAADGVTALPEVTLGYAAPEPGATVDVDTDGWALNRREVSLFDVDKDGVMDLLRLEKYNHLWKRNRGGSFDTERALTGASSAQLSKVRLLDLTGDSGAEMVRKLGSTWRVYRLENGAWQSLGPWPGTQGMDLDSLAVADLDGDFLMDAVTSYGDGIRVWFGGEDGFATPVDLPTISAAHPEITPGQLGFEMPDVNGDGLSDVVHVGVHDLEILLGRGDGTFAHMGTFAYPWGGNADPAQIRLGDLDRDGIMDLVRVDAINAYWYRGMPGGDFEADAVVLENPDDQTDWVVTLADANGNGSTDVVWSSLARMTIMDMAGPTTAGMLVDIDNGMGKRQAFQYRSSASLAFEDEADVPWHETIPVSIPVAVESRISMASGEADRVRLLDVRDGVYDRDERAFVGFLQSQVIVPGDTAAETRVTTTWYHGGLGDERGLRGQMRAERVASGEGAILRTTERDLYVHHVPGLPVDPLLGRPLISEVRVLLHEGVTTPIVTRVRYEHDAEGRVVAEHDDGLADVDGDESVTRRVYASNDVLGVRDRVCHEALYDHAGTQVSWRMTIYGDDQVAHAYDPAGNPSMVCEVGKGWVREVRGRLQAEDRWVVLEANQYDAVGNQIAQYADGIRREMEYDVHGLHPVAEVLEPSPGTVLRWTMDWDYALGKPTAMTGPDGVVTRIAHDGLGRVVSRAIGDAPPHVHHRYDWSGPRPQTETFQYDGDRSGLTALPSLWTPDGGWRHRIEVTNSAGEALYAAERLSSDTWIVSGLRERDARGRTTSLADAFYWQGMPGAAIAAPAGTPTQAMAYDAFDRVTTQTLPGGATKTTTYAALSTTVESSGLAPVTTFADARGRIVRTERTVGGTTESVDATYDARGKVRSFSLQDGAVTHSFAYDSLGRLREASDPDIGVRLLTYDDRGFLIGQTNGAGQTVAYAYDGAGRLTEVDTGDARYEYHYDEALDPASFARTAGRLAWVEEPTGRVEIGYDILGREDAVARTIGDRRAVERKVFSPSGLLLSVEHGDDLRFDYSYDPAGRAIAIGDLWSATTLDAAGRVLAETFGARVTQTYVRDALGQPSSIDISRSKQTAADAPDAGPAGVVETLYGVDVTRNAFGAITSVVDRDGVGLDHTASFSYDGGGRLTAATIGAPDARYTFSYAYDGLQNMTERTASGPTSLGVLTGAHAYGGAGHGPRQLARVTPAAGPVVSFTYDAAGRTVAQGDREMAYNALDQLVRVTMAGTEVRHAYGHDGARVETVAADGGVSRWFTPGIAERGGVREHYVRLDGRLIARVSLSAPGQDAGALAGAGTLTTIGGRLAAGATLALGLALVLAAGWRARRQALGHRPVAAAVATAALLAAGCGSDPRVDRRTLPQEASILYYHHGIAAGPVLITGADGTVFDERRFTPFGHPIDALAEGASAPGPVDFRRELHNSLGKKADPDTGWSDHGARWMAPESGRWLTPDPPVKTPNPEFMTSPWGLHPYQYVKQNPVLFWDPDGNYEDLIHGALTYYLMLAAGFDQKTAAEVAVSNVGVDYATSTRPVWYDSKGNPRVAKANFISGHTKKFHFSSGWAHDLFDAYINKRTDRPSAWRARKGTAGLGMALHAIMDYSYNGPHAMGEKGFINWISGVGHKNHTHEDGTKGNIESPSVDHAFRNYDNNTKQLWTIWQNEIRPLAVSRGLKPDDDLAWTLIQLFVGARSSEDVELLLNSTVRGQDITWREVLDTPVEDRAGFGNRQLKDNFHSSMPAN